MASSLSNKEIGYIRKFDGRNFVLWKERMKDVLIQKNQLEPLSGASAKPASMSSEDWSKLDALAKSTIRLHLAESVFFMVVNEKTAEDLWRKLCAIYEKKSVFNKVHLMKKLIDLKMQEEQSIASHLNEFNKILSQLQAQNMNFDDELKAIFLLCSLPSSWDTFWTTISNPAAREKFNFEDVLSSLLVEEISRKFLDFSMQGQAPPLERGRSSVRSKSQERSKTRSKSCFKKDIICFHCGKKGHKKKDCFILRKELKAKRK